MKSLSQVNGIRENIGYPDYLTDDNSTRFENEYAEVSIDSILP